MIEKTADFGKNIATKYIDPDLLEPFVACRVIPLNKNTGIRPIGNGEIIRRIVGKTISIFAKENIEEATGPLQT